mgnify:CR=1 FL=1
MKKFLKNKYLWLVCTVCILTFGSYTNAQEPSNDLAKQAQTFQTGLELAQQNKLTEALDTWQKLAESEPLIPELKRALKNNIAAIMVKQKRYEEAKNYLNNALKADSQVATTISNLNKLYAYDAQKAYQKVFKDTQVVTPQAELLYFDVKRAEIPNKQVITDIADADGIKLVKQATDQWRQAWVNQDIEGYLSFYDDKEFLPRDGQSISAWKRSRYPSLQGPKFIKITTENVKVAPISDKLMRVSFYQRYQSDRFQDDIDKVLMWKKIDGEWKIIQEVVIYSDA